MEPDEYHLFEGFCKNPEVRLPNAFNYIDARDLGQAVDLCLFKDGLGYEVFNVSNDQNSVNLTTENILKRFYPKVPLKREDVFIVVGGRMYQKNIDHTLQSMRGLRRNTTTLN